MAYILLVKESRPYFTKPTSVWQNYSIDTQIPTDIYLIHIIQLAYYVHSIYSSLAIDLWRKDTPTLLFHHVICIALMFISIFTRSHNAGLLVMFLHDGCDILLEGTKLTRYFRTQAGQIVKPLDIATNVGFAFFAIAWFISRLYWFPLKAIWPIMSYSSAGGMKVPFILTIGVLLWSLLLMNIYWFSFIVKLIYKVITKQVTELEDNREYDEKKSVSFDGKQVSNGENKTLNARYYLRHRNNSLDYTKLFSGRSN